MLSLLPSEHPEEMGQRRFRTCCRTDMTRDDADCIQGNRTGLVERDRPWQRDTCRRSVIVHTPSTALTAVAVAATAAHTARAARARRRPGLC